MRRTTLMALLWLAAATAGGASPVQAARDDRAAIVALVEQLEAANNAGSVEQWTSLFADDFVYMAPGAPAVTDRASLVAVAKAGFRNRASIEIVPVEIELCGGWAFVRSEVKGTVKLHGSGEVVAVGVKEVFIARRSDAGSWKIARLIMNGNE